MVLQNRKSNIDHVLGPCIDSIADTGSVAPSSFAVGEPSSPSRIVTDDPHSWASRVLLSSWTTIGNDFRFRVL